MLALKKADLDREAMNKYLTQKHTATFIPFQMVYPVWTQLVPPTLVTYFLFSVGGLERNKNSFTYIYKIQQYYIYQNEFIIMLMAPVIYILNLLCDGHYVVCVVPFSEQHTYNINK